MTVNCLLHWARVFESWNERKLLCYTGPWFSGWKHHLLYPIADLLAGVKGIFQSQSQGTFMVCNHPNLLSINLSLGSIRARLFIVFLAGCCSGYSVYITHIHRCINLGQRLIEAHFRQLSSVNMPNWLYSTVRHYSEIPACSIRGVKTLT